MSFKLRSRKEVTEPIAIDLRPEERYHPRFNDGARSSCKRLCNITSRDWLRWNGHSTQQARVNRQSCQLMSTRQHSNYQRTSSKTMTRASATTTKTQILCCKALLWFLYLLSPHFNHLNYQNFFCMICFGSRGVTPTNTDNETSSLKGYAMTDSNFADNSPDSFVMSQTSCTWNRRDKSV